MASNDYDDLLESFMNNSQKVYNDDKERKDKLPSSYNTFSTNNKKSSQRIRKKNFKDNKKVSNKKPPVKKADMPTGLSKFLKILLALVIIFCVVGIVCLSVISIYGYSIVNGDKVFDLDSEKYSQNQTSFLYGYDNDDKLVEITRLHGDENRIWLDMSEMNEHLGDAFISIEDERFQKHHGVDWKRTIGVTVTMSGQGGSTITQQLIKNLTDENSVTFVRKFNEILSALNLEKNYSKDEILEAYLNTIYLSEGCYGVKTAAETYFGKDVKDLNIAECATLAGITKFPTYYDPLINPDNNKERQEWILGKMNKLGKITDEEYKEAMEYKLVFTNSPDYKGSQVSNDKTSSDSDVKINSYYTDFVISEVLEDLQKMGYSSKKADQMLYGGGLKIYTSIDFDVQDSIEDVYVNYRKMPDETVQGAMVVMDYHGRVLGMVGGAGEKTANRTFNRAWQSKRQPGSTIKPISVYGPALEKSLQDDNLSITWSTTLKDAPLMTVDGEPWPTNEGKVYSNAMTTLQKGLARSWNTISARTLDQIGVNYSYDFITNRFHISTLEIVDEDYAPMATGAVTNGVTVLDMTAAYQAFGNGGYYCEPYAYYKIEDAQGNVILEKDGDATKEIALSETTAGIMNKLLQTVMTEGTGSSYRLSGVECFGKTGTTTENKDRWFVGGTPEYVAAVWYGYDNPKEVHYSLSPNPCGTIWNYVFRNIYERKGINVKKFEVPDGIVQREYSSVNGLLCSGTGLWGWYDKNNLPATTTVSETTTESTSEGESGSAETTAPANTTAKQENE